MRITWRGVESLEDELRRLSKVRFDAVERKQLSQMLNRARNGGTPVDSGELRLSSKIDSHEMGYTAEHGPHVEYGHRTIGGGFIKGQRFLMANVDEQRPIYKRDLIKQIKRG